MSALAGFFDCCIAASNGLAIGFCPGMSSIGMLYSAAFFWKCLSSPKTSSVVESKSQSFSAPHWWRDFMPI